MKSLAKREKVLLISAIISIIFYLYYFFYLSYILNNIKCLKNEMQILKKQQNISNNIDYKLELAKLTLILPNKEDSVKIIDSIKTFCELLNLNLYSIKFQKTYEVKDFMELKLYAVPVEVIISGDYENLCRFINKYEEYNRICEINTLDIHKNLNDYFMHVKILFYFVSEDKVEDYNKDGEIRSE